MSVDDVVIQNSFFWDLAVKSPEPHFHATHSGLAPYALPVCSSTFKNLSVTG